MKNEVKAVFCIGALVAGAVAIDGCAGCAGPYVQSEVPSAVSGAAAMSAGAASPTSVAQSLTDGVWDRAIEEFGLVEGAPAGFEAEAFGTDAYDEVYATGDGSVMGMVATGDAASAFDVLCIELTGKGWLRVESGYESAGTFVKDDGVYRWMLVSCSDVANGASVVVQVR